MIPFPNTACPTCGAQPGEPCWSEPAGMARTIPHTDREAPTPEPIVVRSAPPVPVSLPPKPLGDVF